jgi:hypothetical protein
MKIRTALLPILALAAAQAAPALAAPAQVAAPAPSAQHQCFYARDIQGFAAQDSMTVNIRVGLKDYYQLRLMASCPDIKWHERLGVLSHGSNFVCSGKDAELISQSAIGPQRCPVRDIRKMTPAEVAGLPKGARP